MTQITKDSAICTQANLILWKLVEKSIHSGLENSGICSTSNKKKASTLSIEVVFIRPGGDRERVFQIIKALEKASQITTLPSEELKSIAYTPDLEDEWKWQRFWSLLLAKCFLFLLLKETTGILEKEKRELPITRWDAKLIEQSAYRYEALYRLIKKGFKYLKESSSNNLANKSYWDIFMEICREEIDFHFEIRTSDFKQFLVDTWIPCWEKLAEQKIERKNLAPLLETQKLFHSQRLLTTLEIFIKKAKRDESLRARLTTYFNDCIELADLFTESFRARGSSGKIHKSEQWKDGKRSVFQNNRPI